ncbi:S-adenosyl-L-methionine-dependent methyltransferase [Aspergillus crustosus]
MAEPSSKAEQEKTLTEYDVIGPTIQTSKELSLEKLFVTTVKDTIGDIQNLNVLDLACGDGAFAARFLQWGAASVTGVDISEFMVKQAIANSTIPRDLGAKSKVDFVVADCTHPLDLGEGRRRQFDLVTGLWLLNHAKNKTELSTMWSNIARHLKPGGRFLGVLPNHSLLDKEKTAAHIRC